MHNIKEITFKSLLLRKNISQLHEHLNDFMNIVEPLWREGKEAYEGLEDVESRLHTIEDFLENMLYQFKDAHFSTRSVPKASPEQDRKTKHMLRLFEFNMPWKKSSDVSIQPFHGEV